MSSISSVRNLQILNFSEKNKEIKKLKNGKKKVGLHPHLYILLAFKRKSKKNCLVSIVFCHSIKGLPLIYTLKMTTIEQRKIVIN